MLRADPIGQRRRPGGADAADLAGKLHRSRHQGRELDADGWFPVPVRPRPAVRSDRRAVRRLQSAAGGAARRHRKCATSRTSPTSWSIRKGRSTRRNHWEKTSHSLLVGAILHVLYAEPDKTLAGVANFLSDPRRPVEATLRAMMYDAAPRRSRRSSRRRVGRARAAQQVRQRTLGRALHRDVVSRPLPRSRRGQGDASLRLAHRRSDRASGRRSASTSWCRPPTSAAPSR